MTRKTKRKLTVKVMFEPSRIRDIHLANAYEKLVPINKKQINAKKDDDFIVNNVSHSGHKE